LTDDIVWIVFGTLRLQGIMAELTGAA